MPTGIYYHKTKKEYQNQEFPRGFRKGHKINNNRKLMETHSTPNEIADLIKDIIQDKVVCDIGCGDGTFMQAMSKYAKEVMGIEADNELAKKAREKDLFVYNWDSFFYPLPLADVYYLWTKDCMGVYLKAKEEGTHGTFIFGNSARPSTKTFLSLLDAEIRATNIPFGENDVWKVFITKL